MSLVTPGERAFDAKQDGGQAVMRYYSWASMLRTVRAPVGVLALGGFALIVPPQMSDMLAFLDSGPVLWWVGFQIALLVLGLSAWFWSRAALAARFGIDDNQRHLGMAGGFGWTAFTWIPRLVLAATFVVGIVIALMGRSPTSAVLAVVTGCAAFALTVYRPRKSVSAGAMALRHGSLPLLQGGASGRFQILIARSPSRHFALFSLGLGLLPLLLGFVEAFTYSLHLPNVLAAAFPGPSVALLLLGLMIAPLTCLTFIVDAVSLRWLVAGLEVGPRRPPILLTLFIAVFIVAPFLVPSMHLVRTVSSTVARSRLNTVFAAWVEACAKNAVIIQPVIVDMSGGATRAGLWGAAVLDRVLREQRPGGPALFAVSSVSGGSLGAAAAMTLLQTETLPCRARGLPTLRPVAGKPVPLAGDALGPLLGGWLVDDIPRSLPAVVVQPFRWVGLVGTTPGGGDSARAIEEAFAGLWNDVRPHGALTWDRPYLDLFYDEKGKYRAGMPIWLANGTDAVTGNRVITSPICTPAKQDLCGRPDGSRAQDETAPWPFGGGRDFHALTGEDVEIETAINNTARFPYLEPFGDMLDVKGKRVGSLIDGGYFENEGIQTALDLAAWLKTHSPDGRAVRPIIVQATANGDVETRTKQVMTCFNPSDGADIASEGSSLPQLIAPLSGLYHVRGGHSAVLLRRAHDTMCEKGRNGFINFYLPGQNGRPIPLNWVLSTSTAGFIWCGAFKSTQVDNADEARLLREVISGEPPGPVVVDECGF